jgi:hypothetical protein
MTDEEIAAIEAAAESVWQRRKSTMMQDGWNFLPPGPARDKANEACGCSGEGTQWIDAAIKIGRKTVFYRDHGVWTLYAVSDNGYVAQLKGYTHMPSLTDCREVLAIAYGQYDEHNKLHPEDRTVWR